MPRHALASLVPCVVAMVPGADGTAVTFDRAAFSFSSAATAFWVEA